MDEREKRELQEAIDRIGPEGMKRLGTKIWMAMIGFMVFLSVLGEVLA